MIANLTRGAKIASLYLPADWFQIAGVLSYLGVDRIDGYDIPCKGQISSGIPVLLEPIGTAERNKKLLQNASGRWKWRTFYMRILRIDARIKIFLKKLKA